MSYSLTIAITHAISFLTSPLVGKYSASTIDRLHAALESQLTAFYKPTWVESDPGAGSPARVLNLVPGSLPPSPIWRSGISCGIQWSDWMSALGGFEFDLFVDPGVVAFRIGEWAESFSGFHVVWQAQASSLVMKQKTLAQSIVDDEENAIFGMIDEEISAPTWMSPILDQFPTVPLSTSPSTYKSNNINSVTNILFPSSTLSRSSSRASSSSSSIFSFSSAETADSYGSMSSLSTPSSCRSSLDLPPVSVAAATKSSNNNEKSTAKLSRTRRSRPRVADVFIDGTKKEVTNYDGGKTTVLTGGVMLGAPSAAPKIKPSTNSSSSISSSSWRKPQSRASISIGRW